MLGKLPDVKEKLLVLGVISGIFLPIRMLFYTYLSSHWIGSLGITSFLLSLIILLAHKKKLGYFGTVFINQLTRMVQSKYGKVSIVISLLLIIYCTSTMIWIEHGNTIYSDEKKIMTTVLYGDSTVQIDSHNVNKIMNIGYENLGVNQFDIVNIDRMLSITYAVTNDIMGGWVANFDMIIVVEQIEFLGFMLVYRKLCMPSLVN